MTEDNFIPRRNSSSPLLRAGRYNYLSTTSRESFPAADTRQIPRAVGRVVDDVNDDNDDGYGDRLAAQSSTNLAARLVTSEARAFTVRFSRSRSVSRLKKEKSRNRRRLRRRSQITAGYSGSRSQGTRGWVAEAKESSGNRVP